MSAARCVNADDAPAGAVRSPARSCGGPSTAWEISFGSLFEFLRTRTNR